jgi:hypothetical protein
LLIAAKAGCGGSEEFYENVVLPWCLHYKENTEDYIKKTWDSISISHAELGAEHVYRIAREHEPSFFDDICGMFATLPQEDIVAPPAWDVVPASAIRSREYIVHRSRSFCLWILM